MVQRKGNHEIYEEEWEPQITQITQKTKIINAGYQAYFRVIA